jgi:hypothetical protein
MICKHYIAKVTPSPAVIRGAGCIFFHCQQYGRAGCIHFHSQQYERAGCICINCISLSTASSMDMQGVSISTASSIVVQGVFLSNHQQCECAGCILYTSPSLAVWMCRVYVPLFQTVRYPVSPPLAE